MNPPTIDPRLLALDRARSVASQTPRAVSVPLGTRRVPPFSRGTSSPPPHTSSERDSSTSDVLDAILLHVEQLEALTDDQDEKLVQLQDQVTTLKRRLEDAGLDADDAGADADDEGQEKKKKKKKKDLERVLTEKSKRLTEKEKRVRKELMNLVSEEMKKLSGTPDGSVIPTEKRPPGTYTLAGGVKIILPDFTQDVADPHNERIIDQAAHLVFDEQKDSAAGSFKLRFKDVAFTEMDVYWIGKDAFRNWKAAYICKTDDTVKEKAARQSKKNTRSQRKRQKKTDRLEMKEEFLVTFGADPTPLLLTDWMSNYVSSLEDGNEDEKRYHQAKMETAAGFAPQRQGDKPVIWERVWPAFRSDKVSKLITYWQNSVIENERMPVYCEILFRKDELEDAEKREC